MFDQAPALVFPIVLIGHYRLARVQAFESERFELLLCLFIIPCDPLNVGLYSHAFGFRPRP